jgi:hypothetical protein
VQYYNGDDRGMVIRKSHGSEDISGDFNEFDNITDPLLMEACIYEINALRAKYNCAVHDLKNLTQ